MCITEVLRLYVPDPPYSTVDRKVRRPVPGVDALL
jgi:hypothetical protein